ncbi:MAG TPA: GNAT family N-acetyltransferase [Pyrinomonadaceae bacterium]|nr:GNAT family N-acetyltransferase [Pyrinomonadaceae bacterium]
MTNEVDIASMRPADWQRVREIYLDGIATGHATFETSAPSWELWDTAHLAFARLVARREKEVVGWAALSPVSNRCVYGGVAEVSVYVSSARRGAGIGKRLLVSLIEESERNGIWTLQAGIFPENMGSIALHVACGFREVGRRERVGKLKGVWRDTILLERRSQIVGID